MITVMDEVKSLDGFSCNFKVSSLDIYNLRCHLDTIQSVSKLKTFIVVFW